MASGSVKSLQVCKEPDETAYTASIAANARTEISAETAGYSLPSGYIGLVAGFSEETNLQGIPGTLINSIAPQATGSARFVGIRSNATSTATRNISCKITFVRSSFVDDRRA